MVRLFYGYNKGMKAERKPVATKKVDQEQNKQIVALKKKVKTLEPEVQVKHIAQGIISFDQANPKVYTMNGLAKGDNVDNRAGNMVKAKKLQISMQLFANSGTLLFDTLIRVLLIKESTALGSALSLSQVFGSTTPLSYFVQNHQTRDQKRYTILKDVTVGIGPVNTSVNGAGVSTVALQGYPSIRDIKWSVPLNTNVNHSRGNAGTEADIETNSYSLVFITDVSTLNAVAHRFEANYFFQDI